MSKFTLSLMFTAAAMGHLFAGQALAEIAVSANDGKQIQRNGVTVVPSPLGEDSISIFDMAASPPREIGRVAAPASLVGPPGSVAVAADETFAVVAASRKLSPANPAQVVPDDVVTVVGLKGRSPRVIGAYHAGLGASGVAINPAGTLALVANRSEGTVSVFRIAGEGALSPAGKIAMGAETSNPTQPAFYDNGRRALVSRNGDSKLSVLAIHEGPEGVIVGLIGSVDIARPGSLDIGGAREFAAVSHGGPAGSATARLSLVDLRGESPRVVDTVETGLTSETVEMSPDGRYIAVNLHNGSGAAPGAAGYNPTGLLQVWRIDGGRLVKAAEAPDGAWGQGVAWSKDGKTLLVQASLDKRMDVFAFDGKSLKLTSSIAMPSVPGALGTAY